MTNQMDDFAERIRHLEEMELAMEERFHSEFEEARKMLKQEQATLQRQQSMWKVVVQQIKGALIKSGKYREDSEEMIDADAIIDTLILELTDYYKFKKLIEYIETNPLLKSQWDKLVMSIRLTGGDENGR